MKWIEKWYSLEHLQTNYTKFHRFYTAFELKASSQNWNHGNEPLLNSGVRELFLQCVSSYQKTRVNCWETVFEVDFWYIPSSRLKIIHIDTSGWLLEQGTVLGFVNKY